MVTSSSKDKVFEAIESKGVKFVRLWFTDILGLPKSFAISPSELEGAFEEGMGFDGSSIQGFARIEESDMVAKPAPETFAILPWRAKEGQNSAGCSATSWSRAAAPTPATRGTPSRGTSRL